MIIGFDAETDFGHSAVKLIDVLQPQYWPETVGRLLTDNKQEKSSAEVSRIIHLSMFMKQHVVCNKS